MEIKAIERVFGFMGGKGVSFLGGLNILIVFALLKPGE
ncbi:hypothetical protein TDIS_1226 [Thermosulfurimonas dismutans]|uniref:Uncharacterized protein n=1 Tax=Thermosulfurimonas dismutans TaxID=999894 RepID=A0A179D474_9BACT|nr:hypothetical protein TDIS_1226 [Thermosulfurimonas dismutans]